MNNVIEADFQVMQDRTPEVIRTEIKTIEAQVYKTTLDGVIQIGNRLQELKEMVGHGKWLLWCEENLGYSKRQMQKYMEISTEYGKENSPYLNTHMCADLSISKAYSLLSLPEEEVESFTENHNIENLTVKELEAEIKGWKQKHEDLEKEKEGIQEELQQAKKEQEELEQEVEEQERYCAELETEMEGLKEQHTDPEELKKLQDKLDKEKENVKKLKEELKQEEEKQKQAINAALEEQKEQVTKEAEAAQEEKIKQAEASKQQAEEQIKTLQKKLEQSGNEDIIRFKLKADQLQEDFKSLQIAVETIQTKDAEQAGKLKAALKLIMETLMKQLEE